MQSSASMDRFFKEWDSEGDGRLDKDEFLSLAHRVGFGSVAEELLAHADVDGSGIVDYREFIAMIKDRTASNDAKSFLLSASKAPKPSPPLLMAAAPVLGIDPRFLLFSAAMAVSCDFMLPVGTPPNAIVFGSGWLSLGRMARIGLVMDLIAMALVAVVVRMAAVTFLGVPLPAP